MEIRQSCEEAGRLKPVKVRKGRSGAGSPWLRASRLLFGLSIVASVLPLGAVNWVAYDFANVLVAGSCFAALMFADHNRRLLALEAAAGITALGFMLWVLVQTTPIAGNVLAHPLWHAVADILGPINGTVSVDPGAGFYALPSVVAPFLTFIACLRLFGDDRAAWWLIGALGAGASMIAAYGLVQFLFFPDGGLVYADFAPSGALTAVLVNRNNTATMLGAAALLIFASALRETGHRPAAPSVGGFDPLHRIVQRPAAIAHLALLLVTLTALVLTMSRAGVGSTVVGFLVMVTLFGFSSVSRSGRRASAWVGTKLVYAATGIALVLLVTTILSGRVWLRVEAGGLDDARWCILPGLLGASRDNGVVGTGLGTFQQVFQAYRDPECGLGFVWDHAHNFYLEGLITLGIPFVIGCLFVLWRLCASWWHGLRQRHRSRAAPAAGAAVTVLVAIHSVADFSIQIPGVAIFVAAALGACAAISENREQQDR